MGKAVDPTSGIAVPDGTHLVAHRSFAKEAELFILHCPTFGSPCFARARAGRSPTPRTRKGKRRRSRPVAKAPGRGRGGRGGGGGGVRWSSLHISMNSKCSPPPRVQSPGKQIPIQHDGQVLHEYCDFL